MSMPSLVQRVRDGLAQGVNRASMLDLVFDEVDDLCLADKKLEVEKILDEASTARDLPLSILLGFLVITRPWRKTLVNRRKVYELVGEMASAEGGETNRQALLRGMGPDDP